MKLVIDGDESKKGYGKEVYGLGRGYSGREGV